MKFILGLKKGMSQIWTEDGKVVPVTVVQAGPVIVTQIRSKDKDGYEAVQVGFGEKKEKSVAKPQKKAWEDLGQFFRFVKEFRVDNHTYQRGDKIDVSVFEVGDKVEVSGTSKGKGFQGVVKRWGFAGGPKSHGQKHTLRAPGSIGATGQQRVFRGKKMAGRMGGNRVTVKNLEVVAIDKENNLLFIKGAVPGSRDTLLEIKAK